MRQGQAAAALLFGLLGCAGPGKKAPPTKAEAAAAAAAARARAAAAAGEAASRAAGIQWVTLPEGTYTRGGVSRDSGDWSAHRVTLKSFQLAKSLVTNKQYQACVAAGACAPAHGSDGTCLVHDTRGGAEDAFIPNLPDAFLGDDQPVVCVDWEQAKAFSKWVGGRLPSEAEWEYAATGAGRDQKYPWGDENATCERAVLLSPENGYGCGRNSTWPVCSKPSGDTAQGLCDMAGDAWEWVEDWWHDSYDGAPMDERPWEDWGTRRVVRGGSWLGEAEYALSANRSYYEPAVRGNHIGFRPAR